MKVSAICCNRYCNNSNSLNRNAASSSFKGALKGIESHPVLKMLKEKVSGIKLCTDMNGVTDILNNLTKKYQTNGKFNGSTEVMMIPDGVLPNFLGDRASQFDLRGIRGLCVGISDKSGPIDTWGKVLEAVTVVIPRRLF